MVDISEIKNYYSEKSDQELIHLVQTDGPELTAEAMQALKEEFRKRHLDLQIFDDIENDKSDRVKSNIATLRQDISGHYLQTLLQYAFDEKRQGQTNQQIEKGLKDRGLDEEHARMLVDSLESRAREGLNACSNNMLIGGIVCAVGLGITLWTYSSAENGGTYVIAWGAIIFGAIRFFRGASNKEKFEKVLNNIREEQLEIVEDEEQNT